MRATVIVDYENPNEYFAVGIKKETSKKLNIYENSILIFRKQDYADDGNIVAAGVDGKSCIGRYRISHDYKFIEIAGKVVVSNEIKIFGKVVEIRSLI